MSTIFSNFLYTKCYIILLVCENAMALLLTKPLVSGIMGTKSAERAAAQCRPRTFKIKVTPRNGSDFYNEMNQNFELSQLDRSSRCRS